MMPPGARKLKVATTSLAGCFGCHMSLLDIDERLLEAGGAGRVRPLAPHRHQALRPLRHRPDRRRRVQRRERARAARVPPPLQDPGGGGRLRHHRRPAGQRNHLALADMPARGVPLRHRLANGQIPNDPELPLPLDKVHPIHEVVRIDYFLPGCPPLGRRHLEVPHRPDRRPQPALTTACCTTTDRPAPRNRHEHSNWKPPPSPENLRRVAIDPVSRVEGHGKVTLLLDDDNHVHQVRLHIVEFRGFEKFIQGRPYWEVPVMVQRLCGICPVSRTTWPPPRPRHHRRRPAAHAHRREDPPPDALRARSCSPTPCTSSTCPRPTCCSASSAAVAAAQHRRRRRGPSGGREAGRAAAQVRPGGHPHHRRQARARHRRCRAA
jgi:hypothetical protein